MIYWFGIIEQTMTLAPIPFVEYYLRQYVRPTDIVLDLGCGPDRYRGIVESATYIGLDITDRPYHKNMPRKVDIVAAADKIPLANSSVDVAFSVSAFFLFPRTERTLSEIRRVLKPGGSLLLFDYNRRTQRRLGKLENKFYPCWTQWRLKEHLSRAGFENAIVLPPRVTRDTNYLERAVRIAIEELFGTWAVTYSRAP